MKHFIKTLVLLLVFTALPAFASANTQGHAWSESVGWFDFSQAVVSNTGLTGHAYNDNTGWLVLSHITNSGGTLSGHAWSESVGWFDFSNVSISSGTFTGYAYNDNTGFLNFTDGTVTTTWAPATRRSGSLVTGYVPQDIPTTPAPSTPTVPTSLPNTIQGLQTLVAELQAQLTQLLSQSSGFMRDLELGMEGSDVTQLQTLLISKGFSIPAGATGYFGPQTQSALIQYQQANNIVPAVGYFGPITRAKITQ